jgi:transcriptional regulator with XRE-family HTH domain
VDAQKHFGTALRRLRTERELTQEEVAFRADISIPYLRGLEAGRYNPTLNVIFDLGRALDIHPSAMLEGIPKNVLTRNPDRKRPGPPEGMVRKS